jgi:hypothetical protein
MSRIGPPIGDDALDSLQVRLGTILPDGYREFLKHYNGGILEGGGFTVGGISDQLDFFYGLKHPLSQLDIEEQRGRFPAYERAGLVVVGETASASLICVRGGSERDTVYYLDVADQLNADGTKPERLLATSIERFCEMLS